MDVRFNFALSEAQDDWLRRKAFEQRASKADIVRGLIDRAMKGEAHQMRMEDLIQAAEAGRTLRQVLEAAYGKTAETIGVEGAELYQYQHDLDRPITRLYLAVDGTMALVAGDTIWHDGNTMNIVTSTDEEVTEEFRRAWALVYPLTTAERIAELLLNDGMRFETEDGRTLDGLTEEAAGRIIKHDTKELWRYLFPDGSAIVASPNCWDIEGSTPWS